MSEKKKNGKKPEVASGISMVSKEKFESAKAELVKLVDGIQGGERLVELVDAGYKKGKLSSGEMMEVLETMNLRASRWTRCTTSWRTWAWTPPGRRT